jgi:large subunit ribosomal protein L30e
MLSKTTVHHFAGTNVALGTAAGKLFRVGSVFLFISAYKRIDSQCWFSVMTILDQGDSDLLTIAEAAAA